MLENEKLKDSNTIIYLIGFNDLIKAIKVTDKYLNPDILETKLSAFFVVSDEELPLYRRTATWKFLKHTNHQIRINNHSKEDLANSYKESRKERTLAKKDTVMPDLTLAVSHYKKNIGRLIEICKSKDKTPIFLTQPVLWRPNISKEGDKLLNTFFSNQNNLNTKTLYKCMKVFNNALLEVCIKNDVQYIDLFAYSEEDWFYDDCHFNEQGAQKVAKTIYENIKF